MGHPQPKLTSVPRYDIAEAPKEAADVVAGLEVCSHEEKLIKRFKAACKEFVNDSGAVRHEDRWYGPATIESASKYSGTISDIVELLVDCSVATKQINRVKAKLVEMGLDQPTRREVYRWRLLTPRRGNKRQTMDTVPERFAK